MSIFSFLSLGACSSVQTSHDLAKTPAPSRNSGIRYNKTPSSSRLLNPTAQSDEKTNNYRAVSDDPPQAQNFLEAKKQFENNGSSEALKKITEYFNSSPEGQYADQAAYILGRQAWIQHDAKSAQRYFTFIQNLNPPSKIRSLAHFSNARIHSDLGEHGESLEELSKIQLSEIPSAEHVSLFSFWASESAHEGHWLENTLSELKLFRENSLLDAKKLSRVHAIENIQNKLTEAELRYVVKEYPSDFAGDFSLIKIAEIKSAQGDRAEGIRLLATLLRSPTGDPEAKILAQKILRKMQNLGTLTEFKVGIILPADSRGQDIQHGMELALGKQSKFSVIFTDAGPKVESALASFEKLVSEDKVSVVLGPINGAQSEAIAIKAQEWSVPYISFSPRPGIVEKGKNIFRMVPTPERQVRALVAYSRERLKAKLFGIVFPRDELGKEFAQNYFSVVEEMGGIVTAAESYTSGQSDFRIIVENMLGTAFPAFRKSEKEEDLKMMAEKAGRELSDKEVSHYKLPPIVDFDVLFIPDYPKAVGQIVPAFESEFVSSDFRPTVLGPSTWNSSWLLARTGQYLDGQMFVDQFSPERQSSVTRNFLIGYQEHYAQTPNSSSALGYDAGLLLQELGKNGPYDTHDQVTERLETLGKLEGSLGLYNWNATREAVAELQLFKIHRGAFIHESSLVLKPRDSLD